MHYCDCLYHQVDDGDGRCIRCSLVIDPAHTRELLWEDHFRPYAKEEKVRYEQELLDAPQEIP